MRIITEDIPRFWAAFDHTTSATDTLAIRVEYLDAGTPGLKDFTERRWKNAKTLTAMVGRTRTYYKSIREITLAVGSLEPRMRAVFRKLTTLYPGAVLPDVYFVVGGGGTGGTTGKTGLLIGVEMFARGPGTTTTELTLAAREHAEHRRSARRGGTRTGPLSASVFGRRHAPR